MTEFELAQEKVEVIDHSYKSSSNMKSLCRQAIAEGCVMLENDGVLPLKNKRVSVFGRCQINTFFVGYGSGGEVKPTYQVSILEGLINSGANINTKLSNLYSHWCKDNVPDEGAWGKWPLCFPEMPLDSEIVSEARKDSEVALVVIGRSAGEDRDIIKGEGSWYLNNEEIEMLTIVRKYFDKVCIIINSGSIMDTAKILKFKPNALLYVWQGGQETGNGISDVLLGNSNPSGRSTDTIALIENYPSTINFGKEDYSYYVEDIFVGYRYFNTFAKDKIIYPFGYGLSYTNFETKVLDIKEENNIIDFTLSVRNIGLTAGKEVVQIYLSKPLNNPSNELVYFTKTNVLQPDEVEIISGRINIADFAMYVDNGVNKNCFVLPSGEYKLYIGRDSIDLVEIYSKQIDEIIVSKTLEACAPIMPFKRMINSDGLKYDDVSLRSVDVKKRILDTIYNEEDIITEYCTFNDVLEGNRTLDDLVNSLDFEELEALTRGSLYAMFSPLGPAGNTGTLAASNDKLFARGIPAISTNDGPSGVRMAVSSSLIPNGVTLASTFNVKLVEGLGKELGIETKERQSHILLAPGVNIHRSPLCGRNFEYYSEDPYVSGMIGGAYVKGVEASGVSSCPKHFACNNQEFVRYLNDSVVSERALREIYLKPFEMIVKNAKPSTLMTSYNKLNGEFTYYNHDLVATILRREWGYDGLVITDWWIRDDESKLFENLKTQAYRVRATVDVFMPGSRGNCEEPGESDGTLLESLRAGSIKLSEIRFSAKNVLNLCLKLSENN